MKAFWALTLNTVRAGRRNRVAMFFTLGLALLFMLIFGELFGGNKLKITFGIVDYDRTQTSQRLINTLQSVPGVATEQSTQDAEMQSLKNNKVDLVVVIPQGFQAALQPGSAQRVSIQTYEGSATAPNASVGNQVLGQTVNEFVLQGARLPVTLAAPQIASVNKITAIDYFLPAMIAYIILQSGINYVAIGLAELRARKVLRRFRVTPIKPSQILGSQVLGGALTVLLQVIVLVLAGRFIFGAQTYGSWFVAAVPILIGTAAFVGIGFLLTSAARSSESARALATMIAFPMMFLSGVFFPITTLPDWLQTVVHVLPLTWLTDALHQVMNDGAALSAIATDLAVLAGWAVVTFALATWRFRWD